MVRFHEIVPRPPVRFAMAHAGCLAFLLGISAMSALGEEEVASADLRELIRQIRQAEAVYAQGEVHAEITKHRNLKAVGADPADEEFPPRDFRAVTRTVVQGEKYYTRTKGSLGSHTQFLEPEAATQIRLFDGRKATSLMNGRVTTSEGSAGWAPTIAPHRFLLEYMFEGIPLSVILEGDQAIRNHDSTQLGESHRIEIDDLGEATSNDLACRKVAIRYVDAKTGLTTDRIELYLAIDRNFLPVRRLNYSRKWSLEICKSVAIVEELMQLGPGIWYPKIVSQTDYRTDAIRETGEKIPGSVQTYTITQVDLNPDYPIEFFQKLEIAVEKAP